MKRPLFTKSNLTFLLLVVLAFSLRSIYFNQTVEYIQPGSGSDSHFYLQWAKDIVRGNIIGRDVFYAHPVYPYFLSIAYLFSSGEIFGLILIQMLIGSINCGLIYILGRKIFNNQVGIIAAVIACAYAMFIFYDRMLLPSSLAILLGLILALLLLKAKDSPGLKRWVGSGLFLGLCILTRASFLLLTTFILFWIFYEYNKQVPKQILLYCLCFILPIFLLIGAVTLRNYLVSGDTVFITAHSGINFYVGNNPQANGLFKAPPYMRPTQSGLIEDAQILAEKISAKRLKPSEASRFWFKRSLSFITARPLDYLCLLGRKLVFFWNGKEHIDDIEYHLFSEKANLLRLVPFRFSLICPLALLGMFLSRPQAKKAIFLYLFVLSLMLATISFFINSRYRLIVVPYLIIFAAFSLWRVFLMCKNRQYKNFIFSLALFLGLYFLTNIKATEATAPLKVTFHYNKGIYLSDRKDYPAAQKEFRAALEINPIDFMSYLSLGNSYYQMKDFSKAIESYKMSLAINPFFYKPHFNLGIIYKEMGDSQQAQGQFEKVLELKPDDCAAHYSLGRLYQEKGLLDSALKAYERALEIEPGHSEVLQAIDEIKGK